MQKKTTSAIKAEAVFFYLGVILGVIVSIGDPQRENEKAL